MVDVFGGESADIFFKHMAEVILVIEAAFRGDFGDGIKVTEVDKILCALDAVDVEVIFKGFVEAFFKEAAKMLGAVLAKGGDIGGGDILVEVVVDVSADAGHKVEHIGGISRLLAVEVRGDDDGVEVHQFGKGFYRPTKRT